MDKQAFVDNVIEAEDTLYRISKSILLNNQDCEDVVQGAILKAYDKLETLKKEEFFKTWLVRILINECYRFKRREILKVPYEEYFEVDEAEREKDYSDLYFAISKLPQRIRVTIVLYYVEGYSINEIKDILRIPLGTVKSRLSKGRKLLKIKLENMEVVHE